MPTWCKVVIGIIGGIIAIKVLVVIVYGLTLGAMAIAGWISQLRQKAS